LTLEADIMPDHMSIYQTHQMHKKYAVGARYQGLQDAGQLHVRTDRLRIDELSAEVPQHERERQRSGTRERVKIGKATQPTPQAAD
jgi:coenzyme F420 hydrogenase subunit beta